jgi:hypothetical protein
MSAEEVASRVGQMGSPYAGYEQALRDHSGLHGIQLDGTYLAGLDSAEINALFEKMGVDSAHSGALFQSLTGTQRPGDESAGNPSKFGAFESPLLDKANGENIRLEDQENNEDVRAAQLARKGAGCGVEEQPEAEEDEEKVREAEERAREAEEERARKMEEEARWRKACEQKKNAWMARWGVFEATTELDLSSRKIKCSDIAQLADVMCSHSYLSSLNLSKNTFLTERSGLVLGEMLKVGSVLKELDISNAREGLQDHHRGFSSGDLNPEGFAQGIAAGLRNNETLRKLTFSGDQYFDRAAKPDFADKEDPVILEVEEPALDMRGKHLGMSGGYIVAAWLSRKIVDKGEFRLSKMSFGSKQGEY